jgi:hypothetical protein
MRRKIPSKSFTRLAAAFGALGLLAAPTASAEPMVAQKAQAAVRTVQLAAADAAGWLVFPTKRTGDARDYGGGSLRLRNAIESEGPRTPALDWLDLWGLVQIRMSQ